MEITGEQQAAIQVAPPRASAPRRALRIRTVEDRVGLKKTSIYELEKTGRFPRRFKVGANASVWWEHEIEAWLEKRAAAAFQPTPARKPGPGRPRKNSKNDGGGDASAPTPCR